MGEVFGRYNLERRIAVGGMAEVFLARVSGAETGAECVVKKMHPNFAGDPEYVTMFLSEARVTAQLVHPNIARVHDFGRIGEAFFMAMEYVPGPSLHEVIKHYRLSHETFPVALSCRIVADTARAIHHAHHAVGLDGQPMVLIHRDISPANILISTAGEVKVIDFGIAKTIAAVQTQQGVLKGKLAYMSPEQVRGQPLDHRSDVFALGLVLYEMLAGRRAITGDNEMELYVAARRMEFPEVRVLRPDCPAPLGAVLARTLAVDREQRWSSAQELADALDSELARQGATVTRSELAEMAKARGLTWPGAPPVPGAVHKPDSSHTIAETPGAKGRASSPLPADLHRTLAASPWTPLSPDATAEAADKRRTLPMPAVNLAALADAPSGSHTTRIGRYEVVTQLTGGGMAELFLSYTTGPGGFRKFVVIKRLRKADRADAQALEMFLVEARITAALAHPNIAQVYDLGEDPDGPFLALEFVAGQNLVQVQNACFDAFVALPLDFSVAVARDVANALHYAHTFIDPTGRPASMVHRDVAPKNVMVTYEGVVKLLDFGLAKPRDEGPNTRVGAVKGTTLYMSPEQVRGERLLPRSDVFSLGVSLYEWVTGEQLFAATSPGAELGAVLEAPVAAPHLKNPHVPLGLSAVLMRALDRDVTRRYATAKELAEALELEGQVPAMPQEKRAELMRSLFTAKIATTRKLLDAVLNDRPVEGSQAQSLLSGAGPREPGPIDARVRPSFVRSSAQPTAAIRPSRSRTVVVGLVATVALAGAAVVGARAAGWLKLPSDEPPPVEVMRPLPPAERAPPPAELPPPALPDEPVKRASDDGAAAATAAGKVTVSFCAEPPMTVSVDGVSRGRAPLSLKLGPGTHKASFQAAELGLKKTVTFQVGKKPSEVCWKPGRGSLKVRVVPYGDVFVDGAAHGTFPPPKAIELYEGEHRVKVVNAELDRNEERTITIEANRVLELKFSLQRDK